MDFIFGCWSEANSSVDSRTVVTSMSDFFVEQKVPHRIISSSPHFAAGVASLMTAPGELHLRAVETEQKIVVGDVTLYDQASVDPSGRAKLARRAELLRVATACGDDEKLAELNGDFAIAVFDRTRQSLALVRDHCGILPLFYSRHGSACAFASLVRPLLMTPWASDELDSIALASYLAIGAPGLDRTYFTGVRALRPASCLRLGPGQTARTSKYWHPGPAAGLVVKRSNEANEAIREQLVRSTIARTRGDDKICVKLSGGLDSSSIAGIVCSMFPDRTIHAVASVLEVGSPSVVGDERRYIDAMGQRYPNLAISYVTATNADALSGRDHWTTWQAGPVNDPFFYVEQELSKRAAKLGARGILDGDGGDYCVSKSSDSYLAECLRTLSPARFAEEFRRIRRADEASVMEVLRHYLLPYLVPAVLLRRMRAMRRGPPTRHSAIRDDALEDTDLLRHLHACGIDWVESAPGSSMRGHEIAELQDFDVQSLSDTRLMEAPWRVRSRFPMLDRELLETCIAIPAEFKVGPHLDRALLRNSANEFLPSLIASRPDKGWFSPDFRERLSSRSADLHQTLMQMGEDEILRHLMDKNKVLGALKALGEPPTASFDRRLFERILFPYHLVNFLRQVHSLEVDRATG